MLCHALHYAFVLNSAVCHYRSTETAGIEETKNSKKAIDLDLPDVWNCTKDPILSC